MGFQEQGPSRALQGILIAPSPIVPLTVWQRWMCDMQSLLDAYTHHPGPPGQCFTAFLVSTKAGCLLPFSLMGLFGLSNWAGLADSVDAAVCIRRANLLLSLRLTVGPYLFHLLMRPCDLALVKTGWDKNSIYYLQILALGGAIASLV